MRLHLIFINAAKSGAFHDLCGIYVDRAVKLGRQIGVSSMALTPLKSGGGMAQEAQRISAVLDKLSAPYVIALDEVGEAQTSAVFAKNLKRQIDRPDIQNIVFIVGGAEGLSTDIKNKVDKRVSFGQQTWPHQLVHVMLAEQIYRAHTINLGLPYHKV